MFEPVRGCGHRKMGGLYIEADGPTMSCDRLPFNIELCPVCQQGIQFTRGFTWIHWFQYAGIHQNCTCENYCPICKPEDTIIKTIESNGEQPETIEEKIRYGLMWVGKKYYSPDSFINEAMKHGISKRIATIPRNIEYGKTWILLAHQEANTKTYKDKKTNTMKTKNVPAVFYAFRPKRIVKIINKKQAKDKKYLENLKKRGITPLIGCTDKKGNIIETFELDEWDKKGLLEKLRK